VAPHRVEMRARVRGVGARALADSALAGGPWARPGCVCGVGGRPGARAAAAPPRSSYSQGRRAAPAGVSGTREKAVSSGGTTKRARELRTRVEETFPELRPAEDASVYVIELDAGIWNDEKFEEENPDARRDELPCLYVGMSSLSPEQRFAQHKAGTKASRRVRKHGIRLRPEFYERLNPMTHDEAERGRRHWRGR